MDNNCILTHEMCAKNDVCIYSALFILVLYMYIGIIVIIIISEIVEVF